jgi:uncharacterized protein YodC (DUF2158 family)
MKNNIVNKMQHVPVFKVGDVVSIKSGGPTMTVLSFEKKEQEYVCMWFAENVPYNSYFPELVLKKGA